MTEPCECRTWARDDVLTASDHHPNCIKYVPPKPLNASEAVYGFAAWLTTRPEKTVLSSVDDSAIVAQLVDLFCKTNNLPDVSEDWPDNLRHPPAPPEIDPDDPPEIITTDPAPWEEKKIGRDGLKIPDTADARMWADEFCRFNKAINYSTMVGWFANAIEAGAKRVSDIARIRFKSVLDGVPEIIPSMDDDRHFLFTAEGFVFAGTHVNGIQFRDESGKLMDAEAWVQFEELPPRHI